MGIETLEKVININLGDNSFDEQYGEFLNDSPIGKMWDTRRGCQVEGFLKKLEQIKARANGTASPAETENGGNPNDHMLRGLYTRLGFYDWLLLDRVRAARANDRANKQNLNDPFHLNEADADAYRGCPMHFGDYIRAFQTRNRVAHNSEPAPGEEDSISRLKKIQSIFTVYIHQCELNRDIIDSVYEKDILYTRIDFVKYAKEHLEKLRGFHNRFLQLEWLDGDKSFAYTYNFSVKFVGDPGMGKTTQMKEMYRKLLEKVSAGKRKILPVWIDLSEFSNSGIGLGERIRQGLGEYGQYDTLLLQNGAVALFLDGYNEVLAGDSVKIQLSNDIDAIHHSCPQTMIALTDRAKRTVPVCLKDVRTYTLRELSKGDMIDYVQKKFFDKESDAMINYIKAAEWLDYTIMIPEKINSLIELLEDGKQPEDENEFYGEYLEYILEREENEKKETRIEDLKYYLYHLAMDMTDPTVSETANEIKGLWNRESKDPHAVGEMLDLAVKLRILVPDEDKKAAYRFANEAYYDKLLEGF
jgi:hypothetical protein